ncbi:MAG: alpha/beta hydrolase, partial [Acidobacteriaceae bacterium]
NGRSDLPRNIGSLQALHALGITVFAFDYRGFGASQHGPPSQEKAYADGVAALHYLTVTRHLDPTQIVVYGEDLGAAVAATVAQQSPKIAGLILENPQPSLTRQVKREQHLHLLPMWLLFRQNFDISGTVSSLAMPKLILVSPAFPEDVPGAAKIYAETPAPKQKVQLHLRPGTPAYTLPAWSDAVRNFLNTLAAASTQ